MGEVWNLKLGDPHSQSALKVIPDTTDLGTKFVRVEEYQADYGKEDRPDHAGWKASDTSGEGLVNRGASKMS